MSDPNLPAPYDAAYPATGDQQLGGIELKTSFFPLAFLLYIFPAKAVIDGGGELENGWGTKVYPMPAGRHAVRVWCPYFGAFKMGDATQEVDVVPGQVTAVEWKCPWLVFLKGTFVARGARPLNQQDLATGSSAVGAQPAAAALAPVATAAVPAASDAVAAGWHPDPHGHAALRYWDGQQWTEHVSEGQAVPA